ncbi:alanine racemase [Kallipyga gabonensis]|uniref:alanine racemase n=1 Tax=Kallipyga gabonensis TaxID=1686287 RepID=UPI000A741C87|nr:alanine racemase [Kallipyga gabonensis]
MTTRNRLVVNLKALKNNLMVLNSRKEDENPEAKVFGVVKANAYGLGAVRVAREIEEEVDGFCVALPEEAKELVEAGIQKPILSLGYLPQEWMAYFAEKGIRPTLYDPDSAIAFNREAKKLGVCAPFHLAIDTGHSRIGILWDDEDRMEKIRAMAELDHLFLEGAFSHFASADEEDPAFTDRQFDRFLTVMEEMKEEGIAVPIRHIANDAALIRDPKYVLDGVRLGISLYGEFPSRAIRDLNPIDLEEVVAWKTVITNIKTIVPGTPVSYNHKWRAPVSSRIATLQVGYADGYARSLTNRADVLIRGYRCPQVGAVCMDQMMVDVSRLEDELRAKKQPPLSVGEEAYLMGHDPAEWPTDSPITPLELADTIYTISYEILTSVSGRVTREYLN